MFRFLSPVKALHSSSLGEELQAAPECEISREAVAGAGLPALQVGGIPVFLRVACFCQLHFIEMTAGAYGATYSVYKG